VEEQVCGSPARRWWHRIKSADGTDDAKMHRGPHAPFRRDRKISITGIEVELLREIVYARVAELAGGAELPAPVPADLEALLTERLQPIIRRLASLEHSGRTDPDTSSQRFDPLAEEPEPEPEPDEPNWDLVRRHFRRYGDPAKTAEKYGVPLRTLNARARKEGWAA
jgi:hypothetical protein